jgi:outer membrane protein TolC
MRGLSGLIALAAFSGCAIGPKYRQPLVPVTPAYKEQAPQTWRQAQPDAAIPRGRWWQVYNDPQLDGLEEQVNISNQNVLAAMAQYRQARDQVRIARSSLFPTVSASSSLTKAETSSTAPKTILNSFSGTRTEYSMPIDVSYQADIWGSIGRTAKRARASAEASAAELENARLTSQASLAQYYFERAERSLPPICCSGR